MDKEKVKFILSKNARVIYFDSTSVIEEIESIAKEMKAFNPAYEKFRQAIIACVTNDLDGSLVICDQALKNGYVHNDVYIIQEVSMFMGVIYRSLGLQEEALKHYLNSLKYGANARAYNNIADIYIYVGEYDEAIAYIKLAMQLLEDKEALDLFDERLLNILYTNLSEAELEKGNIKKGRDSALKCIEMGKQLDDVFTIAFGYTLLGTASFKEKEYESAMSYYEKANSLYADLDTYSQNRVSVYIEENKRYQCECLNEWGHFLASINKLKTLNEFSKRDYELMISNYEGLKAPEIAFKYYRSFMDFLKKDEMKQRRNRLEHFKAKIRAFESEKKANDYELLYNHIKSISGIGKDIIAAEKLDDVLIALHSHIDKIMDFNSLALAIVQDQSIDYNWVMENNQRIENFSVPVGSKNSFTSWVVRNKKAIRLNDALTYDELKKYKEDAGTVVYGHAMDSMVLSPIVYKDKVYGVINVQSSESYTYSESDLEVINMLASFIAIAMKNWSDTESLKEANEKLEQLSKTDALTGISNRHVLSEIVEDMFRKSSSVNNTISVVMIDIDHFKEYNDTYGHIDGDRCLITIVNALKELLDINNNRLFRYGGDEFVAIMPYITSAEVEDILEKVREKIESLKVENKNSSVSDFVTCSFGYTTVERGQLGYQRAFYLADEALYMAKAQGKNRIACKKE